MEQRYYRLGQFLGCYLHEDWPEFYGTPANAVDVAISEYPIEYRKEVRRQLRALLAEAADDVELRKCLNRGLGVNVNFRKPTEARAFAEQVEQKLLASIKQHFEQGSDDVPL